MKLKLAVACSALAVAAAAPAFADIIFIQGNAAGSLDAVQLSGGALDAEVTGTVNPNNTAVLFTGLENLISPSSGQARIAAADGTLNSLDFNLAAPNLGFLLAEFNLNALASGWTTIKAFDQFGSQSQTFNISSAGQNFFNLQATNGQVITRVEIDSSDLADIRQVRIGGVTSYLSNVGGGPIPEPASWALMILGFGGIGAVMRHRRHRAAPTPA